RLIIVAHAGYSRPEACGFDQPLEVKKHDVAKTLSTVTEVVPVLLAVVEHHARAIELPEITDRKPVCYVILVLQVALQVGDEHHFQTIRRRNVPQILRG